MDIKNNVKTLLKKIMGNKVFLDDDNIMENGLLNSLFAMELVVSIEKEYGIKLKNEDLELENFQSINSISNLIQRKLAEIEK